MIRASERRCVKQEQPPVTSGGFQQATPYLCFGKTEHDRSRNKASAGLLEPVLHLQSYGSSATTALGVARVRCPCLRQSPRRRCRRRQMP